VSWLGAPPPDTDYGYAAFLAGVDALLIGRATYEQIIEFGGVYPYAGIPSYVFTSRTDLPRLDDAVEFVHEHALETIARLKLAGDGVIWLCGGGALAGAVLDAGLLDEIDLFVQPTILGDGIPLFARSSQRHGLRLLESRAWPGELIEVRYEVLRSQRSDAESGL
jgi:dihydrofolate reductase